MDEFGHLIDSSHLDSVGAEKKVHNQDTGTLQQETTLPEDDTNTETLSKFASAESPLSMSTLTEMIDRKYEDATAVQAQKELHNTQGGSASASWPGSSMTGWFGLNAVEKPDSMAEGEEQDEIQPEVPLTSKMTGWLGLGGQEKRDDVKKTAEEVSVNADSLASTMTGWLGFGGKEKTDHMSEREHDSEKDSDLEEEPAGKYRSRKMSMNIEDTHKETEGTSTLEWLGNGLSNRFGLSLSNQESDHMEPTLKDPKETTKEEEQSSSWFDMGIENILGFNKGKVDVDGSTGSSVKGTEQSTGSENVNGGQSQPAMMEEVMAVNSLSEVVKTQKDKGHLSEIEILPDDTHPAASNSGKEPPSAEDLAYRDALKDISTQTEANSQAVGDMSSMLNSLFHKGRHDEVQDNVLEDSQKKTVAVDEEESAEFKNNDHQMQNTIEVEEKNGGPREENASVTDRSFMTHNLATTFSSQEHSDLPGPTADKDGKRVGEEKAHIPGFKDNVDMFVNPTASSDREDKGHDAERALPVYDYPPTQDQGSKGVIDHIVGNQSVLSSGSAGEYRQPVSNENDNLTNQETTVAHLDSLLMTDKVAEAHPDESAKLIQSPHSVGGSIRNMSVDVSGDDVGRTTQATIDDNTAGQKPESDAELDAGVDIDKENGFDGDILEGTALQTGGDLQTEIRQMEKGEMKEDLMRRGQEVKPPDNQQAVNEVEQEEMTTMEKEGEEARGEGDDINKDKGEVVWGAKTQKKELTVGVEEVQKEEKQEVFGTKDEKLEDAVQESKEVIKKVEETQAEEKRVDEGQSSHNFRAKAESIVQNETQSEESSRASTQTENRDAKALQDVGEGRDQEEKVKNTKEEDYQENVEVGSRDEPHCPKQHCSEAPADGDGNTMGTEWISMDLETGERHLPMERDQDIAERQAGNDFESMEEDESRKQEEQDRFDSVTNDISDSPKDLLYSSMTDDDLILAKVENTRDTEENMPDTEPVNKSTFKMDKMATAEDSGQAEVLMTTEDDTTSVNLGPEVRTETVNKAVVQDESEGGLNLLKGAFGYFSQTSATKLVQNLDSSAGEEHSSLTPEPELDTPDVHAQDVLAVPSITSPQPSPEQESKPSTPPMQMASPLHPQPTSLPAAPHHLHQTKGLSKHYKSLLAHMSVDEIAILLEHFGRHKLQFLDYICGRSAPMFEELDHDESILLDVERLLHYHLEALKAPRTRLTDAPQEEKEKTRALVALEKLQLLVTRVKEMFNRRKLDIRSTNHQGISDQIRLILNHFIF